MNVKLLAASALFVKSGALLVFYRLFCSYPVLIKPTKVWVHKQVAKLFQQHCRHLNSAFEADRLLEQKCTGSHLT
jgi:hypothetical protein